MEAGLFNLKWGNYLLKSLVSFGVEVVVTSPGSRSTPLTLAACSIDEVEVYSILDERSAAFFALGLAKSSKKPVVLICTSGTAVANYYPAVIEASQNDIPLILLTADRPSEIRDLRPGQTINQLEIYGKYVRYFSDLPTPSIEKSEIDHLTECLEELGSYLYGMGSGPVHLNCPYREPLLPDVSADFGDVIAPVPSLSQVSQVSASTTMKQPLPAKTLILAGPIANSFNEELLVELAELSNSNRWPVLSDASFTARHRSGLFKYLISHYDLAIRNGFESAYEPDGLLIIGEPPTSKVMRQHFDKWNGVTLQIPLVEAVVNPMNLDLSRWFGSLPDLKLGTVGPSLLSTDFAEGWKSMDNKFERERGEYLETLAQLFEGTVYRFMANQLEAETPIVVANSLAIRDVEWFWPANDKGFYFQSMRGANGIDGTLSYARGSITGFDKPGVLLTGDLAFLHDSNGLLQSGQQSPGLLVVVFNNKGGGIFNMLPISRWTEVFESKFATPQDVDLKILCQAHGIPHQLVSKQEELKLFEWTPPAKGIEVLEIQIDRFDSTKMRLEYFKSSESKDK